MVSEPTMLSSTSLASSGIGTLPGCHAGVVGATFRLCSGSACLSARAVGETSAAAISAAQTIRNLRFIWCLLLRVSPSILGRLEQCLVARNLFRELVAEHRRLR